MNSLVGRVYFRTYLLEEPNDDDRISVGILKQLTSDPINAREIESPPNKEAVELFCHQFIQSTDNNNYCLFIDHVYQRFMERNSINMNEILFRMLLRNHLGSFTFTSFDGKNGWRGKKLISSDE